METGFSLPNRDLIDGLFGLLFFFFNSATERDKTFKSVIEIVALIEK